MSLEVQEVGVRLDGADVLADVSLAVADREVVSVLGPSGSGKTTLLRVIAGLQHPTSGRVVLDGRDVTDVPTHRRGVGLMFQDHALFPHRDVAGNVGFGLRMARTPRAEAQRRIDEVLDLVGLAGIGGRSVDNLSGGERQRVALARALAPRPTLLLLDEPLGSLDRALRDRLLDDLADVLRHSGATVLHVTHDQGEAFATGDRVVVVRQGRIAQVGTPDALWHRPVDADVARIVGPTGVVPVEIQGSSTLAPWGPVEVARAERISDGRALLVLRPDDLEVRDVAHDDGAGPRGTVVARAFRGDHVLLRVEVRAGEDAIELPVVEGAGSSLEAGDAVGLRLLPGRGVVVGPSSGPDVMSDTMVP